MEEGRQWVQISSLGKYEIIGGVELLLRDIFAESPLAFLVGVLGLGGVILFFQFSGGFVIEFVLLVELMKFDFHI